ncbi:MAG TPA: LPS-assembly protein LptD [Bacteroidetes bacterium]|nr:LPS-assembly protein LptD [Bacteroidota bacterium]
MYLKTKVHIIISILLFCGLDVASQTAPDTALAKPPALPPADSLPAQLDSLPERRPPAFSGSRPVDLNDVKLSADAPEEQIDYEAKDSMLFDSKNQKIHLFGEAKVSYQDVNMTADYILIDWNENTMTAEGKRKPGGGWLGKPTFTQGGQDVSASKLKYNFKTFKGIIYNVQTMQQGMNVVGTKGKFIGAGEDSTKANIIYNSDAIFSTCDLEQPHFGIRSKKQKIVQDKVAIVGPSNLEIGGIPTPIWLPFGFFPMTQGQRTGLIFPRDYEFSEAWGYGLRNVGWYFPMNDYWDLALTGDIYFKGTFRTHALANYRKRYKYNGNLSIDFARQRQDGADGRPVYNPSTSIRWSHNQDPKAHPYHTFGGSINIQTSGYQQQNNADFRSQTQRTLRSNMSYKQRFDAPFDLSASFNHSQNTSTKRVSVSFPTVNFQTQALYPFKRKLQVGGERWYERVQVRYTSEARNQFEATDSTLFTKQTLNDAQFGVRHNVSTSTSFNLLKYFNVTPNANYKEVWYFRTVDKTFDPTAEIEFDTIYNEFDSTQFEIKADTTSFGNIIDNEKFGFKPLRQFNVGISMNTRIFGTMLFKRGKLRGLRHVISPSFGFNFTPDYTNPDWGYFKSVRKDLRNDEVELYNIFENNKLSGFEKPSPSGRQMTFNYSFGNQFEAKIYSKKEEKTKNIKLFRSVSVAGNYNFAADSMRWSTVRVQGNTNLFNGITTFRFNATYDPYERDNTTGRRINKLLWDTQKKLLRLNDWSMGFTTNLTVGRVRDLIKGINTDQRLANEDPKDKRQEEDLLSLFENFRIAHSFTLRRRFNVSAQKDSIEVSAHTISSSGTIKLTPNWDVRVGNFGYDFQSKRITYPDFTFTRNLHCWEMGLSWQPFFNTYSFYIRVKPGHLDFINIPYSKRIQDARRR